MELIKARKAELEKPNRRTYIQNNETQLRVMIQIVALLEEYTMKQRWEAYCYHLQELY